MLDSYKLPLLLSVVGIVLIIAGLHSSHSTATNKTFSSTASSLPKESLVSDINLLSWEVDIAGAVNKPGPYTLPKNSRMDDLVKAAGGFSEHVNQEYISKYFNLSQKVTDGEKV